MLIYSLEFAADGKRVFVIATSAWTGSTHIAVFELHLPQKSPVSPAGPSGILKDPAATCYHPPDDKHIFHPH